ncbi:flagellar export chaperone FliS [Paenibacillus sp. KQZ6P-2]|uniref:Flagellar secretion chaperone FliS n=1 Tax=Paenibacillus mangrovi TaxID=2931978 RepID=A0A9X2B2N4_9BACL|nr:flagellar export chaperone FliS [Paenibacillus mangrovi]MCJ8012749.1 flagellar export chaperone FliS [Paenibacillus mangrovi]
MGLHVQENYIRAQVQTASPGELTLMLYNGCIRFLKTSLICIEGNDISGRHNNLIKAQNIVDELQSTLDMNYEISHNLFSIYDFIQFRLQEANTKQSKEAINESIHLLTDLRDTWMEALKSMKKSEVN